MKHVYLCTKNNVTLISKLSVNSHLSSMSITKHHVTYSMFSSGYKSGTIFSQEYIF